MEHNVLSEIVGYLASFLTVAIFITLGIKYKSEIKSFFVHEVQQKREELLKKHIEEFSEIREKDNLYEEKAKLLKETINSLKEHKKNLEKRFIEEEKRIKKDFEEKLNKAKIKIQKESAVKEISNIIDNFSEEAKKDKPLIKKFKEQQEA